jgi:hypothetical protein
MTLIDGVISLDSTVESNVQQGLEVAAFAAAKSLVEYYQRFLDGKCGRSIPTTRAATWEEKEKAAVGTEMSIELLTLAIQGLRAGSYDEQAAALTAEQAAKQAEKLLKAGVGKVSLPRLDSSYGWYEDVLYYYQGRAVVVVERFDAWCGGKSTNAENYTADLTETVVINDGGKIFVKYTQKRNGSREYRPFQSDAEVVNYEEDKDHLYFIEMVKEMVDLKC